MPRHSNKTMPARARVRRTRVLVRNTHMARVGGNCALADFQVMPPFGRSMVGASSSAWRRPDSIQEQDAMSVAVERPRLRKHRLVGV